MQSTINGRKKNSEITVFKRHECIKKCLMRGGDKRKILVIRIFITHIFTKLVIMFSKCIE